MGGSLRLASKGKILIDPGLVLRDMDGGLAIASGLILVSVGVGTASMIKLPDSATIRSVWTGIPESECLGFCSAAHYCSSHGMNWVGSTALEMVG